MPNPRPTLAALCLALPAGATGVGAGAGADTTNPLAAERWETRPIVVVVPQDSDPLLAKVRAALKETAAREAFRERDMALFTVVGGEGRRNGEPLGPGRTAAMLRALQLDARGPGTFILVGKDGGVKMREEGAGVDLQAVFDEIDRMPMRQQQQR